MNETATTIEREDVESLSAACIDVTPVQIDWRERMGVDMDGWRVLAPLKCTTCERVPSADNAVYAGDSCPFFDADDDGDATIACDGELEDWMGQDLAPMMNYYYPLPALEWGESRWDDEDARKLDGLPVVLVEFDDGSGALALSGGGMDLSWEICEAFMNMGFLPPFHFARDLPSMCGRGTTGNDGKPTECSDRDRWILDACRRSAVILSQRAGRACLHIDRERDGR